MVRLCRHHDSYKLHNLQISCKKQAVRLCYPSTLLQINNLQIYPCKKQAGGTFMLSNRQWQLQIGITYRSTHYTFMSNWHHDSYNLSCKKQAGGTFMTTSWQLQIRITYRSTHVKSRQVVRLCYPFNRHHRQLQIRITYRYTHVKSRQVVRLCYPIDIMTATN